MRCEGKRYNRGLVSGMSNPDPPFVMERYGRLAEMDCKFDIAYRQR